MGNGLDHGLDAAGPVLGRVDNGHHGWLNGVGDGPDGDVRWSGVVLCVGARGEGFFFFRGGGVMRMSVPFGEGSTRSECINVLGEEQAKEREKGESIHPCWTAEREKHGLRFGCLTR